jgi:RND family efflux transporter MFP subunit
MRRLASVLTAIALPLALAACGSETAPAPETSTAAITARHALVAATLPDLKPVSGQITTRDEVMAVARIGGILTRLNVKAGDQVRAGQIVALISDDRLSQAAGAASANVAAAEAEAARATADLGRIRELHAAGVYANARLESATAMAKAAQARARAARGEAGAARALGGQGAVMAPAAGRVLSADVPPGSPVMPGQLIARLSAGPLLLRLDVPETAALALKPGDTVRLVEAGLPSQGRIDRVWPGATAGLVRVDVQVAGLPDGLLGRRVSALVPTGTRTAVLAPRRFVRISHGIAQVALLQGKSVVQVPVELAETADPTQVELLTGVTAGDVLVLQAERGR